MSPPPDDERVAKRREEQRRYRLAHPERIKKHQAKWRAANPDKVQEDKLLISKDPKYANVVKPYLIGDDLVGEKDAKPTRYVIDFSGMRASFSSTPIVHSGPSSLGMKAPSFSIRVRHLPSPGSSGWATSFRSP